LIVEAETLSSCLEVSSWSENREVMGIRHRSFLVEGVQFHPESILTENGKDLLGNFIDSIHSNQDGEARREMR
jgi:anthranilate/para-aminobenzoate synthase component II